MSITSYKEVLKLGYNLAPSQLTILDIPNKKTVLVQDMLDRELKYSDNGNEVGSINYISHSSHYFIRAKAVQPDYFLMSLDNETAIPIRPQVFQDFDLKEGDLIISKDSNIGEAVILDKDYPNYTISGALYKLPITNKRLYLFAFLKHRYFRQQLDLLVPKGSTIRHAKTLFLDCKIPLPNQSNADEVINYVEIITQAIINKEREIRRKNQSIFQNIEKELIDNQKSIKFEYENPKFSELISNLRIDSGYYCLDYKQKQFLINNYKYGADSVKEWKFEIKRGQNLQVSQIGKSIYSDKPKEKFYTLIRPTNFSGFGTVERFEYLGNSNKLALLEAGDIVFSAEGTIGKCVLFDDPKGNWITNIHGIVLNKKDHNIEESAFVCCFLRFLRHWNVLDYISVGGQGGSLAKKYWKDVRIPKFQEVKQAQIAHLYHNPMKYLNNLNQKNFLSKDQEWNKQAGIIELDKSLKQMKETLNTILDKIVNDKKVKVDYNIFE